MWRITLKFKKYSNIVLLVNSFLVLDGGVLVLPGVDYVAYVHDSLDDDLNSKDMLDFEGMISNTIFPY